MTKKLCFAPNHLKKSILPLFCYLIVSILLFLLLTTHLSHSQSPVIAFSAKIVPNMDTMTYYYFTKYIPLKNMTFNNGSLQIDEYWINSTEATNNVIAIHNWFDSFGTSFTPQKSDIILLYSASKGNASVVYGASAWSYNSSEKTFNLTVTSNQKVTLHWETGGFCWLYNPDIIGFGHGWGLYKTCYGRGIVVGDLNETYSEQRLFHSIVYAEHGESDIQNVDIQIGNNLSVRYDLSEEEFTVKSDPNKYLILKEKLCGYEYDSEQKYLIVNFIGVFQSYEPRMQLQNLTTIVNSVTDGNVTNVNFGAWFVWERMYGLPVEPLHIPFLLIMPIIGTIGLIMTVFAPYYMIRKAQQKEYRKLFAWGSIMLLIGIGCTIGWLWG